MGGALVAALTALGEGLKLVNTERSRTLQVQLMKLRLELLRETELGYDSDDARVKHLEEEIKITAEAAANELALAQAKS